MDSGGPVVDLVAERPAEGLLWLLRAHRRNGVCLAPVETELSQDRRCRPLNSASRAASTSGVRAANRWRVSSGSWFHAEATADSFRETVSGNTVPDSVPAFSSIWVSCEDSEVIRIPPSPFDMDGPYASSRAFPAVADRRLACGVGDCSPGTGIDDAERFGCLVVACGCSFPEVSESPQPPGHSAPPCHRWGASRAEPVTSR